MSPTGSGVDNAAYVRPLGSAEDGAFRVAITPTASNPVPGWRHTSLRVATTAPGGSVEHDNGDEETLVVPLAGSFRVEVEEADGTIHGVTLAGRASVFDGPSDVVYAGRGSRLTVTHVGPDAGRVALCGAPAHKAAAPKPFRHLTASEVPVELRGAGLASREVRNMGLPDVLDADSFLVCEVITPAGNWSSWPPHKHDEERAGKETALEEIYYVETRSTDPRGTGNSRIARIRLMGSLCLPSQPERELDFTSAIGCAERAQDTAGSADAVRSSGMIQHVERIHVKPQVHSFGEPEILDQARIHGPRDHAGQILILKRIGAGAVSGALNGSVLQRNPDRVGVPELGDVGVGGGVGDDRETRGGSRVRHCDQLVAGCGGVAGGREEHVSAGFIVQELLVVLRPRIESDERFLRIPQFVSGLLLEASEDCQDCRVKPDRGTFARERHSLQPRATH
jgi:5-deoxy-glucuronate isomerase